MRVRLFGKPAFVSIVRRLKREWTHPIHGQVVANAVLPSFGPLVGSLVGVLLEPVVNVAKDHLMVSGLHETPVNELRVRLSLGVFLPA